MQPVFGKLKNNGETCSKSLPKHQLVTVVSKYLGNGTTYHPTRAVRKKITCKKLSSRKFWTGYMLNLYTTKKKGQVVRRFPVWIFCECAEPSRYKTSLMVLKARIQCCSWQLSFLGSRWLSSIMWCKKVPMSEWNSWCRN